MSRNRIVEGLYTNIIVGIVYHEFEYYKLGDGHSLTFITCTDEQFNSIKDKQKSEGIPDECKVLFEKTYNHENRSIVFWLPNDDEYDDFEEECTRIGGVYCTYIYEVVKGDCPCCEVYKVMCYVETDDDDKADHLMNLWGESDYVVLM